MAARVKSRDDTATNRESDKIIVRLPAGMRRRLAMLAAANKRSMNAEVIQALARHFAESTVLPEHSYLPDTVLSNFHKFNQASNQLMRQIAELFPEEIARSWKEQQKKVHPNDHAPMPRMMEIARCEQACVTELPDSSKRKREQTSVTESPDIPKHKA